LSNLAATLKPLEPVAQAHADLLASARTLPVDTLIGYCRLLGWYVVAGCLLPSCSLNCMASGKREHVSFCAFRPCTSM
jgi:hypothetical protein